MENTENTEPEVKTEVEEVKAAVAEAVADAVEQQEETGQPEKQSQPEQTEELTQAQINWKAVREKTAQTERERNAEKEQSLQKDDQIAALTQAMQNLLQQKDAPSLTQKQQDQVISDLIDDDIPTGGEVKSFLAKYVPNIVEDALKKVDQKRQQEKVEKEKKELPQTLRRKHKDFNDIVHDDNLKYLDYHYPEVSTALSELPEGVDKWSMIYGTVKKLVPNIGKGDVGRLEKNAAKPQNITTSSAPLSKEQGHGRSLSDSEKATNYQRMVELARGI